MASRSRKKPVIDPPVPPTPEQQSRASYVEGDIVDKAPGGRLITIGKAFRRRRMVETLAAQGYFSDAETKALLHYRHHADMIDRSLVRDSLCIQRHGGDGGGPTIAIITAERVASGCEGAAGSLRDILRAVVVNDLSLSEWAMERNGSIEECEVRRGKRICRPKPRRKSLDIAKMDIQMVAKRVEAELSA